MAGIFIIASDIKDADTYGNYAARAPDLMARFGGIFRVRGGERVNLEGEPAPDRIVMVEFESVKRGQACFGSADYRAIAEPARDAADVTIFALEGNPLGDLPTGDQAPGYLIAKLTVSDEQAYAAYSAQASTLVPPWDGALVAASSIVPIKGSEAYERAVVIRYPSLEKTIGFYNSPEYQATIKMREHIAVTQFYAVKGV
jgi:uncharacterized protein (DUF1330 family)